MRKIMCVLMLILFSMFTVVGVSATETDSTNDVKLPAEPNVTFTADSVVKTGMSWTIDEFSINTTEKTYSLTLVKDFEIGYTVYDDPETDIIDGIRVNGNTINNFRIDGLKFDEPCEIVVRTVYTDGIGGMLAQMHDGVYDYTKLLSNPVMLLQVIYYILLCVTAFAGLIYGIRSKKRKAKTADEIANAVDVRAQSTQEALKEYVAGMYQHTVVPTLESIKNLNLNTVKAIILSTSKSKEAPLSLLELLNDPANADISALVEKLKAETVRLQEAQETTKQNTVEALTHIAQSAQEDTANGQTTAEEAAIF